MKPFSLQWKRSSSILAQMPMSMSTTFNSIDNVKESPVTRPRTILFTNARNEKNIVEWTAHHLNLGFDFIYILDHNSDIPIVDLFKNKPNNVFIIN